jgi:hypothetical protein
MHVMSWQQACAAEKCEALSADAAAAASSGTSVHCCFALLATVYPKLAVCLVHLGISLVFAAAAAAANGFAIMFAAPSHSLQPTAAAQ